MDHRVQGVDHVAFPTFDPGATVRFYRDVLGFPVVHSICAAGWGPEDHPDFIHFFFDIGKGDRIAFFYYFGTTPAIGGAPGAKGDAYARFAADVPEFFVRSRHLAIHVARVGEDGRWRFHYDPGIAAPFRGAAHADIDLTPLWMAVRSPVLILRGAESDLLTPAILARMLDRPGTQAVEVPRTGHAPMLMDDFQVGAIRDFLLA